MTEDAFLCMLGGHPHVQVSAASALERAGVETPSIAQRAAMPAIARGENVAMQSHTGSGKTLAYVLPLLATRLKRGVPCQALVVCPSRDVATQLRAGVDRLWPPQPTSAVQLVLGATEGGVGGGSEGQLQGGRAKKKTRVAPYTLMDIPPALQRELDSFAEWRLKPINRERDGVSVEPATAAGNRADALRLLGWLKSEKNIAPSLGGVFGSERLDQAVQAFVEHLRACGRTYATCAGYIRSFIAVARFVHAARVARAPRGSVVSTAAVDAMRRAHRQIMQQARLEQKFSAAKPKAWLDWPAVLTARARAVSQYELRKEEGGPGARARLFDAALLTWLTVVPPDRVGVARKLQLGVTLKPTAATGGFELDLRTPDAHKTAALFGPSTSPVPAAACALLRAWLAEAGLAAAAEPYVFVLGGGRGGGAAVDHSEPLGASRWTEAVKAVLKRQAGVPLAPKDLRSSFITFLLSEANPDEALKKAVAHAMRHSPAQQGSAAYDKEAAERAWASAVRVAGAVAARFA